MDYISHVCCLVAMKKEDIKIACSWAVEKKEGVAASLHLHTALAKSIQVLGRVGPWRFRAYSLGQSGKTWHFTFPDNNVRSLMSPPSPVQPFTP